MPAIKRGLNADGTIIRKDGREKFKSWIAEAIRVTFTKGALTNAGIQHKLQWNRDSQ